MDNLKEKGVMFQTGSETYMGVPNYLGLSEDLCASYYIGTDWLVEGEVSVIVEPKIKQLNYVDMLMDALTVDTVHETNYFSKCYKIDFNRPEIEAPEANNLLSPILLIHYVSLLERVVKYGLKKDYVTIESNLNNKVKGHLLIAKHLHHNVISRHENRAYCCYQTYTEDIPVNRLLKQALIFADRMLKGLSIKKSNRLQVKINALLSTFSQVSEQPINISSTKAAKGDKIFRHYADAIEVAKLILRRCDFSLSEAASDMHKTPPFWIDMSRLFEMYVYKKLYDAYPGQILFQVSGYQKTAADYVYVPKDGEMPLVIDAKYKPRYDYTQSGILLDIREMSGYARDNKILRVMKINPDTNSIPDIGCLIIYPTGALKKINICGLSSEELSEWEELQQDNNMIDTVQPLWENAKPIHGFHNFRKLNIPLPTI